MELALKQAKSLKEFKQAMRNGSKEFPYNGCTYQYREEVTIDLSKCEGPYAEDWQLQQSVIEDIDRQIAALRNEQKAAKSAMEADGKNYLSENPECKKVKVTTKTSLVVL
jgi:flagellar biosynthesis chaperone FliJ